jgi:hypothetical protein
LSSFSEIKRELERRHLEKSMPTPMDTASFNELVSYIEDNLARIEEISTRSTTGIIVRIFKGPEKQRLQKLFLETRELLIVADESRVSVPRSVRESNIQLLRSKAADLSVSLQQWLGGQQVKTSKDHEIALFEKIAWRQRDSRCNAAVPRKKLS